MKLKCTDCKNVVFLKRNQLRRAARARCYYCGGPLNHPKHVYEPTELELFFDAYRDDFPLHDHMGQVYRFDVSRWRGRESVK